MSPTILTAGDFDRLTNRAARNLASEPRSFIRWAGSKRSLLSQILPVLPQRFGRYYEPFLGGGALFFLLQPERAVLNDRCVELINSYRAIRDHGSAVTNVAQGFSFNEKTYYKIRSNRSTDPVVNAGEFLFLNHACFNGLYRVNSSGQFNVPWGASKTSYVADESNILACQAALAKPGIEIMAEDFQVALKGCRTGDLVFFDPPYVTRHNNNGFVDYNESLFSWRDQTKLAETAEILRRRGATIIVTNAFHADILNLYPNFDTYQMDRQSTLAGATSKRGKVSEALLVGKATNNG